MIEPADMGGEAPCWAHLVDDLEPQAAPKSQCPVVIDVAALAAMTDGGADGAIWSLPHDGDLDANVVRLRTGNAIDEHVNGEVDVLLVVWSGTGTLDVDDATIALAPGVLASIPKGARRSVRAGGDDLTYLSIHRRRGSLSIRMSA